MDVTTGALKPALAADSAQDYSAAYSWYVVFVLMACYMLSFINRQILSLLVILACQFGFGPRFALWAWRVPFLLSVVLLALSVIIRSRLGEFDLLHEVNVRIHALLASLKRRGFPYAAHDRETEVSIGRLLENHAVRVHQRKMGATPFEQALHEFPHLLVLLGALVLFRVYTHP